MTQLLPRLFLPRSFLSPPSIQFRTFTCSTALQKKSNRNPKMATVTTKTGQAVDRLVLDSMLRRRMFYTPSFEIYGGVSGLYDYGPPGTALVANMTDLWRKHFVLEEDMLEVDCTMLTPHEILKTSGHVDKFADWMCKDPKTGEIFRADHLVEEVLENRLKGDKEARGQKVEVDAEKEAKKKKKSKETKAVKLDDAVVKEYEETLAQIDNFGGPELEKIIEKYDIRNPATDGKVLPPVSFNLMFQTSIGPSSNMPGYLRPETAQGQFLNFQKLLEFNQQSMPFASASIGKSFRNEISPRAGLLRVREFLMAEIEHYVDPEGGKKHPRFVEVKDIEMSLLDRNVQLSGSTKVTKMTIGKAVETGLVDNETLGYFLARIQLFLLKLGIDFNKLRFRQHMANEMAHYAADCWDAELQTSYGWIECVGCADRSAYDLTVHKNKTGAPLVVRETRSEPLRIEEWQIDLDKKKFGPRFKKDSKTVEAAVEALSQDLREKLSLDLEQQGKIEIDVEGVGSGKVELEKDIIQIEKRTRVENVREYTPNVIEPSFGIGRIMYSMIEHVYWSRAGDEARGVLSFPPAIAPTKVLLVPLSTNPAFKPLTQSLSSKLRRLGVSSRVDDSSASIGKRYARNDELGTPFGITVDFQSVKDNTFTLRDRDTTKQVRASEDEILQALKSLAEGDETWEDVAKRLPEFTGQEDPTEPWRPQYIPPNSLSPVLYLRPILIRATIGVCSSAVEVSLIDTSCRDEITETVELSLSRDEDSVTSLAAAPQLGDEDSSLTTLAGINSSVAQQKKNNNQHMRSFRFDVPKKKQALTTSGAQNGDGQDKTKKNKDKREKQEEEVTAGKAEALSRASLFRTKGESGDTYQRVLRLSPWKKLGAEASQNESRSTRVGAIATGLASSGEIVFFQVTESPTDSDVIGRIRLGNNEEAEDVDFVSLENDPEEAKAECGRFRVAYTNGADVNICEISSSIRSNTAPEVRCVYTIPVPTSGARAARPKFRALRFISPNVLLLLQNAPERSGSELILLRLPAAKHAQATIVRRRKLPRSTKIGLGLDICALGTNPAGQEQTVIAASGSDHSIALWTLEYGPNKGYGAIRPYTTLRDVHPFSMTKLVFSPFNAPLHPITPDVPPQKVKLASISMGNTVVVHTLPLSPFPASSRTPRYVLSLPGPAELWEGIYYALVLFGSFIAITFAMLAFAEIRGGTPPFLGAAEWLPPAIRNTIANEYIPPSPGQGSYIDYILSPKSRSGIPIAQTSTEEAQIESLKEILDRVHSAGAAPADIETVSPHALSVIVRCNEHGQTAEQSVLIETFYSHHTSEDDSSEADKLRAWKDLSGADQAAWKQRLTDAGRWAAGEGETVLQGVLFSEACGQLRQFVREGLP
ncbi:hypothetical protein N7462_002803 [Penicillium macrosclerotiorum]|uniref:uncharacterized protein n=1 Tax=Penicillium macrosclerotiorum TaxID=303699 RepID=UPI002548F4DC|nr:uncharacterized protein N7462_002803 [Penicillium macrosclerotiorum]KAJ5693380.1 hypothetical protein N7462_002803 [Penicillium macrosclerotiorum]